VCLTVQQYVGADGKEVVCESSILSTAAQLHRYAHPEKSSQDEKVITGLYPGRLPDRVPECLRLRSLPVFQYDR